MCGIVGYSGPKEPLPILIAGLSRLEYRGYDSAGIAVSDGSDITIEKKEGKLDVLKEHLADKKINGNVGIGTNSPAQRLDIDSGNFRTTGTIYMGTLLESLSGDIKLHKVLSNIGYKHNQISYIINWNP